MTVDTNDGVPVVDIRDQDDWIHKPKAKKKKTKEAAGLLEPFKQGDGDKIQNPKVQAHQDGGASPIRKGKMSPSGYANNKKERV